MNTECAPETRFARRILVILLAGLVSGCKLKYLTDFYIGNTGASLPGRGLTLEKEQFVWTLNAGILNDRNRRPLDRVQGEAFLGIAAAQVEMKAPWLKLRFILDQPLDAEYILTTLTRDKKALQAARRPESRILDLDPADLDHNSSIEKLDPGRISPLLRQLKALQLEKNETGLPLVGARPENSLLQWRLFLRDQVRYDIILTNAAIFPDEIDTQVARNPDGTLRSSVLPALGRSAGEQIALLLSVQGGADPGSDLKQGLFSMLLLDDSGARMDERRRQLRTLVDYYKTGKCPDAPAQIPLSGDARRAVETAYQNVHLACGAGKKD